MAGLAETMKRQGAPQGAPLALPAGAAASRAASVRRRAPAQAPAPGSKVAETVAAVNHQKGISESSSGVIVPSSFSVPCAAPSGAYSFAESVAAAPFFARFSSEKRSVATISVT